jgi:DNA-binding NarL/FixJ family response regulator
MTPDDALLKPAEAARLLGVRPAVLARWSREGRITPLYTPGAHRRYSRSQLTGILRQRESPDEPEWVDDAVLLYKEGRSIRQIAAKLDSGYGTVRRHLRRHLPLRNRGGSYSGDDESH